MNRCYECESELTLVCQNCNTRPTPAPCDELETVGWLWEYAQYRTDDRGYYGYETVITESNPTDHVSPAEKLRNVRELVTRQNAEEVIAAEREEKEKLEAAWLEAEGIISDLKADNEAKNREIESITKSLIIEEQLNAAKDARIKELEGEVFYDQVLGITWKQACEQCNRECAHYQQNAEALEADNAAKDARIKELEDEQEAIFSRIPMGYLLTHAVASASGPTKAQKLADAMRDYSEARWHLFDRIKALEADNKRLREALENLVERFSYYAALAKDGVPNIEDWAYTEGSSDIDEARAALGEVKP